MADLSLLAVYAHPYDEAVLTGGTLAKYAQEGIDVYLISATRGETTRLGNGTAPPSVLEDVCAQELNAAARILGVKQVRFLDYFSGQLPVSDAAIIQEELVRAIRELKPQVVITFGPEGIYGHPDHVALHDLTTEAFLFARDPDKYPDHVKEGLQPFTPQKLYYFVLPRSQYAEILNRLPEESADSLFGSEIEEGLIGTPDELVTAVVDVRCLIDTKLRAIECHRTEIEPSGPFGDISIEEAEHLLSKEHYVLGFTHLAPPEDKEDDLFAGLR